jgi:hypothetical protein
MRTNTTEFGPLTWHWRDCQDDFSWGTSEPREPRLGQGWYDARMKCLYIWDGRQWVCVPAD